MSHFQHFVGLISGTSVDGVDAVVLAIGDNTLDVVSSHCEHYPQELRQDILSLSQPGINEIDRLGAIDQQIAEVFARAALTVIGYAGLGVGDIAAIGSHGQTVRHRPDSEHPFTLQIGDPNRIAEITGITTVADFRRRDMAAGGQGAPLAPAFHRAAFAPDGEDCAVVNIGGIANVTVINREGLLSGYDTGPGNTLMDYWIRSQLDVSFDENGEWARSGVVDSTLLTTLLADPYFSQAAPKSTGPEYFSPEFLQRALERSGKRIAPVEKAEGADGAGDSPAAPDVSVATSGRPPNSMADSVLRPEDVQRTLLELTAQTIAAQLAPMDPHRVAICGGGAHNHLLMTRLGELLSPAEVTNTEVYGIDPDWVEAACFAWLAHRTLSGLPGNEPSATGAAGWRVLGAIYPA